MAAIEEQDKHRTPWKNMLYYFSLKLLNHLKVDLAGPLDSPLRNLCVCFNRKIKMVIDYHSTLWDINEKFSLRNYKPD